MLNYKYKLIDICINCYELQVVDNYNNGTGIHKKQLNKKLKLFMNVKRHVIL